VKISCEICKNILEEPGAILLSPSDKEGMVKKTHICTYCHDSLVLTVTRPLIESFVAESKHYLDRIRISKKKKG